MFYLMGVHGRLFTGQCSIISDPKHLTQRMKRKITTHASSLFSHHIQIGEIRLWERPKPLHSLVEKLGFMGKKGSCRAFLQGGLRIISEDDYHTIVDS